MTQGCLWLFSPTQSRLSFLGFSLLKRPTEKRHRGSGVRAAILFGLNKLLSKISSSLVLLRRLIVGLIVIISISKALMVGICIMAPRLHLHLHILFGPSTERSAISMCIVEPR